MPVTENILLIGFSSFPDPLPLPELPKFLEALTTSPLLLIGRNATDAAGRGRSKGDGRLDVPSNCLRSPRAIAEGCQCPALIRSPAAAHNVSAR